MFYLFLKELQLFLQNNETSGLSIDDVILILLLFADDMIIWGDSPDGKSLQFLDNYGDKWSLEVNTFKTKALVFWKQCGVGANELFFYKGNAYSFNY